MVIVRQLTENVHILTTLGIAAQHSGPQFHWQKLYLQFKSKIH